MKNLLLGVVAMIIALVGCVMFGYFAGIPDLIALLLILVGIHLSNKAHQWRGRPRG